MNCEDIKNKTVVVIGSEGLLGKNVSSHLLILVGGQHLQRKCLNQ